MICPRYAKLIKEDDIFPGIISVPLASPKCKVLYTDIGYNMYYTEHYRICQPYTTSASKLHIRRLGLRAPFL